MASKKNKAAAAAAAAPADDNLDELFSGIGNDPKPKKPSNLNVAKSKPTSAAAKAMGDNDILADLESELAPLPSSRPHTPRLKETVARRSTATPPAGDDKLSAVAAGRKSTDSSTSLKASFTSSATSSDLHEPEKRAPTEQTRQPQKTGGGWWGGLLTTASGVMKQAEAAYNHIQQNEEAKKWADQVKGFGGTIDVGALRSYGDELRNRAMPTFANILNTIAPPIGSHERLLIHITHDLVGYPSLDPLVYQVFSDVMSQVEGGDLAVIQRSHESGSRRARDTTAGWRDGPWWRQLNTRDLGYVKGMIEGTKLCRASAEAYAHEYFAANGGVELARARAMENASETNPVRTSDIFLSIQAISTGQDNNLFARTASAEKAKESSSDDQEEPDELVCFAIFMLDPIHEIEYSTVSQTIPARWARWLDAPSPLSPESGDGASESPNAGIPHEIRDIIEGGGLDPREWVAEWMEETLKLAAGVVAQRYVARRMGVGEHSLGRSKRTQEDLVQDNAGEAARAGVF